MRKGSVDILLPSALAVLGCVALVFWLTAGRTVTLDLRLPGEDGVPDPAAAVDEPPPEPTGAVRLDGQPSSLPGSWPCFRGRSFDAIADDGISLGREWPAAGPEVLWNVELGPGHAGAAVDAGRVFVLDYDLDQLADVMRCFSLDDGREIWHNGYPVEVSENHGMSRTVPAVSGDYVVSLGPKCHVACWSVETGDCLWLIDLVREYGAKVPSWYAGQCPIIDGDRVILAPCGKACLIAVDLKSGDVVWESDKVGNWEMTHVSILPMALGDTRMFAYCGLIGGAGGIVGVDAEDGTTLWQTSEWIGKTATCPTPVHIGDGRLFCTSGYGAGAKMIRLSRNADDWSIASLFAMTRRQFESEQHTPIFHDGHIYGVRSDAGGLQLVCLDLDGNEMWNSGRDKIGRGPYMIADGLLILLAEDGLLIIAEATSEAYRPLAKAQVIEDAHDAWGPLALVEGRLILRDLTRMKCVNLAVKP